MSRRTELIEQLLQSNKWGEEKEQEQRFLAATAELILTDFINIACNGLTQNGAGSLIINLQNDSTTYMSGHDIERDIRVQNEKDEDVKDFLLELLQRINDNDWSKYVLITLISDAGTRTLRSKQVGAKKASERSQENSLDKLNKQD